MHGRHVGWALAFALLLAPPTVAAGHHLGWYIAKVATVMDATPWRTSPEELQSLGFLQAAEALRYPELERWVSVEETWAFSAERERRNATNLEWQGVQYRMVYTDFQGTITYANREPEPKETPTSPALLVVSLLLAALALRRS